MFIHFLLAMLPIIWLIIALSGLKMAGHVACPIALIITVIEALFLWKQKIIDVLTGGLEGFAMAIWPICLVIVAAVFTYNLVVHTKENSSFNISMGIWRIYGRYGRIRNSCSDSSRNPLRIRI